MQSTIISQLAPHGVLRVALNLANTLLSTAKNSGSVPVGVAPDIGAEIARRLHVPVEYVCLNDAGAIADSAADDVWDIGMIGADPGRMDSIAFTSAYAETAVTGLVGADSPLSNTSEVDRPGTRIVVVERSAFDLWLTRHIKQAQLVRATTPDAARALFFARHVDVLAGLEPHLVRDASHLPDTRVLGGQFTRVQQAVATLKKNIEGMNYLRHFIDDANTTGLIASYVERHGIRGLVPCCNPTLPVRNHCHR